jgi:hypothetical protein
MNSNLAQEEIWIDAWSELYEIAKIYPHAEYQLPDESVSFEDCLHWLQDSAYAGYGLKIEKKIVRDYMKGQPRAGAASPPENRIFISVHRYPLAA